jgi:hypothetical protein
VDGDDADGCAEGLVGGDEEHLDGVWFGGIFECCSWGVLMRKVAVGFEE